MSNKILLTATKPMRYNTRHLVAGDTFEARAQDAKVLKALGKATDGRKEGEVGQIPERLAERVKPSEMLYGSSLLNANYTIGDRVVQLGEIVRTAHKKSELTIEQWNKLPTTDRETRLQETLDAMISAAAPVVDQGDEGNDTGNDDGDGTGTANDDADKGTPGLVTSDLNGNSGASNSLPPVDEKKDEPAEEDIQTVREHYMSVVGRRAYAGWDIPTLKEKIAEFEAASKK